jgi:hypothetical protein
MDPYEIKIGGVHLTVRPNEDGTYVIFRGETRLAKLSADDISGVIVWETDDWIDDEYATTIGEAIEEHEKNNVF